MKKKLYLKKVLTVLIGIAILLGVLFSSLYYFRTPILIGLFGKDEFPVVVLSGTWEEMGYQVGSRMDFAKSIRRTASFAGKSFPPEKAKIYFDTVESFIPQNVLEQMKGLAKGLSDSLKISYDEAWKDVLVWNFFVPSTFIKGCTAFAVNSPEGNFLAHNTDIEYLYGMEGSVQIFKPDSGLGYPFVSFFPPGFVGVGLGENITGLAVVFNVAYPSMRGYGLPPTMMVRKVMEECRSLEEVLKTFDSFIYEGGRFAHNGAIFTFIDFKTGEMARIELAPDRVEVDRGKKIEDNYLLSATNHYRLMPERNQREDYNTSSYARLERVRMLLAVEEEFTVKSILKILSDHDGKDMGTNHTICRHRDRDFGTSSTHIFDDNFVMYYILRNPCRYWKDQTILQTVKWKDILEKNMIKKISEVEEPD